MKTRISGPLFGWLLDKHNLRYISSVGDGDSKSYTEASKMAPYGPAVFIPKEDCIAHDKTNEDSIKKALHQHTRESKYLIFQIDAGNSKMVLHYYSQHYLTFSSAVVKEKIILATLDRELRIMSMEFYLVV